MVHDDYDHTGSAVSAAREAAREAACPECRVAPGEACIGSRGGARTSNHAGRAHAAEALRRAHTAHAAHVANILDGP